MNNQIQVLKRGDLDYRKAAGSACCILGPYMTPR